MTRSIGPDHDASNKPSGSGGVALELGALNKKFGENHVVKGVSLSLKPGQLLTLLGPSGSGKTTVLRMIAGFDRPDSGHILVDGKDIAALPPNRRNIGVVFQNYALFPHMTVFENLAYPLQIRRRSKGDIARLVANALGLVQLKDMAQRYPRQLSGGQQQRVAVARAIVFEPTLLLMDEPLGALDKRLRESMQVELRELQKRIGITTITVTHDQTEALAMSDLLAVLDGGVLQQLGPPLDVYRNPANRFVAEFLGDSNLLEGTFETDTSASSGMFRSAGGILAEARRRPQTLPGTPVQVLIRPENVRIDRGPGAGPNSVDAEITSLLALGEFTIVRLVTSAGERLVAKLLGSDVAAGLAPGARVTASWSALHCAELGA